MKDEKKRFEGIGTKIDPAMAEVLNACCDAIGVDVYHLLQWFAYTIIKASAPMHQLDPRIQKLMTMLESDAGWQKAFNLCNPDELKVAKVILILEQQGHKGFGAVMLDQPFMDKAPEKVDDYDPRSSEPQMTENVDDILERILEVTMPGIYNRLRRMGARMQTEHFSDVLLRMIDDQTTIELEESFRAEMPGMGEHSDNRRQVVYGKKSKAKQHRTPDSVARDQRFHFDDYDREIADMEAQDWEGEHRNPDNDTPPDGIKPFGEEW